MFDRIFACLIAQNKIRRSFFFSSRRRHTRLQGDWSSDVCSSDLGETYSGMAVGGEHTWLYPNGLWKETKVAPDRWDFTFSSLKERERSAPPGSGVPVGTQYHWYILAHQRVRKIDADS